MLLRTAGAPLLFGLFGFFALGEAANAQYYPAYPPQAYPPRAGQQLPVMPADDEDDPFYDPPVGVHSRPLPPPPGAVLPAYPGEVEITPRVPGQIAREVPPGAYPPAGVPAGPDGARPPMPVGPSLQSERGVTGATPADARFASLPPDVRPESGPAKALPAKFQRTIVEYKTKEPAGTIVIDTPNTYLYLVLGGGKAMRYGVGVGREGFTWTGVQKISRMAEWPDWTPPEEMIERQPYLPRFMAGGETNPLGARALYLGATVYRIHGTNQPSTIGTFVSSGCIRLTNADVTDLYSRVKVGTRVVVLPGGAPAPAAPHSILPQAAVPPGSLPPPPGAVPPGAVPGSSVVTTPLPPPPTALAR
jgi:lipoprotein-anchoring transpeptidase ErfK/SrfK